MVTVAGLELQDRGRLIWSDDEVSDDYGGNAKEGDSFALTSDSCVSDGLPEVDGDVEVLNTSFCHFKVRIQLCLRTFFGILE